MINNLFEELKIGDNLIVTELSKLGRNMLEILNLIETFNINKINLIFINQRELSTKNNLLSKLLYSIYSNFAETEREREIISERIKQGVNSQTKETEFVQKFRF